MPHYSPILAAVTGGFEVAAAVYALTGPGRKTVKVLAGTIFILLAGYQFAEIAVCMKPEVLWLSRLAYFVIAWMPPVVLRLVVVTDARRNRALRVLSLIDFGAAAGLCAWIVADPACITRSVCQVVTARFFPSAAFDIAFGVFFQTGLVLIVFSSGILMASSADERARKHLANLQLGVLGFMLPALAVRVLISEPEGLIPSVMCHFALIFAASLAALVVRERRLAGRASG
jgi:hypothetical protein